MRPLRRAGWRCSALWAFFATRAISSSTFERTGFADATSFRRAVTNGPGIRRRITATTACPSLSFHYRIRRGSGVPATLLRRPPKVGALGRAGYVPDRDRNSDDPRCMLGPILLQRSSPSERRAQVLLLAFDRVLKRLRSFCGDLPCCLVGCPF
jgi:hypothetical protein